MNSRLLLAFLCVASLSTGCIIVDDNPPTRSGDVTFFWTLAGLRCDDVRDVGGVNIRIPGERLHNGGNYACQTDGADGITLHDFAPGSYDFTIEAVDYRGVVLYEGHGSFFINGDERVEIDLTPAGSAPSYAYLTWTFPGNMSCAQAGVSTVEITVDELGTTEVPCREGQVDPGKQTPYISPGEHRISFTALAFDGTPLYYFDGGLFTEAYRPASAEYRLTDGAIAVSWRFSDGSLSFDCGERGTTLNQEVGVNFQDTRTGEWLYGEAGDWHPCQSKPIVFRHLRPGANYKISLYTITGSGVEYGSNSNIEPVLVEAEREKAREVLMYRL